MALYEVSDSIAPRDGEMKPEHRSRLRVHATRNDAKKPTRAHRQLVIVYHNSLSHCMYRQDEHERTHYTHTHNPQLYSCFLYPLQRQFFFFNINIYFNGYFYTFLSLLPRSPNLYICLIVFPLWYNIFFLLDINFLLNKMKFKVHRKMTTIGRPFLLFFAPLSLIFFSIVLGCFTAFRIQFFGFVSRLVSFPLAVMCTVQPKKVKTCNKMCTSKVHSTYCTKMSATQIEMDNNQNGFDWTVSFLAQHTDRNRAHTKTQMQ